MRSGTEIKEKKKQQQQLLLLLLPLILLVLLVLLLVVVLLEVLETAVLALVTWQGDVALSFGARGAGDEVGRW